MKVNEEYFLSPRLQFKVLKEIVEGVKQKSLFLKPT